MGFQGRSVAPSVVFFPSSVRLTLCGPLQDSTLEGIWARPMLFVYNSSNSSYVQTTCWAQSLVAKLFMKSASRHPIKVFSVAYEHMKIRASQLFPHKCLNMQNKIKLCLHICSDTSMRSTRPMRSTSSSNPPQTDPIR